MQSRFSPLHSGLVIRLFRPVVCRSVLGLGALSCMAGGVAFGQTAVVLPNSPSLTAETSNQLFENGLDDLQHPALLAGLDRSALYTLLTNQSAASEYFVGAALNVGPGGLALLASLYGDGTQGAYSEVYYDESGDEVANYAGISWNQRRRLNLYAGYGLPVRPLHVGVGTRIRLDRSKSSADEDLDCGSETYVYNDLENNSTSTVTGSCEQVYDSFQLFGSVHWMPPGKLSLLADFSLQLQQNYSTVEVEQDSPDYTMSASGNSASSPFGAGGSTWLGLELRPKFQLDEALVLTGIFAVHGGLYPEDSWSVQTDTRDNTTGIEVSYGTLDTYSPSKLGAVDLSAFVAGHWSASPAASLRLGLGVRNYQSRWTLGHELQQDLSIESSDTVEQVETSTQDWSTSRTDVFAPVSLQVRLVEKLALRISSQFTLSSYSQSQSYQQLSSELDGEDIPFDNDFYTDSYVSQWATTRIGAELLFQPSPRTDVSLATSTSNLNRQGTTTGGLNLYASATVYW